MANQAVRSHSFAGGLAPSRGRQTRRMLPPIGTPRRSNPVPAPPARRLDHLAPELCPEANGHVTRAAALELAFIAQAWHSISADAVHYLKTFFQESAFQADSSLLVQEEMARFLPILKAVFTHYIGADQIILAFNVRFGLVIDRATQGLVCVPRWVGGATGGQA